MLLKVIISAMRSDLRRMKLTLKYMLINCVLRRAELSSMRDARRLADDSAEAFGFWAPTVDDEASRPPTDVPPASSGAKIAALWLTTDRAEAYAHSRLQR